MRRGCRTFVSAVRGSVVLVSVLVAAVAVVELSAPTRAPAALGDCSQPVGNGAGPTATDCLFILRVAVGTQTCSPPCICAPKGTLPTSATDALICLKKAVGQSVALICPCASMSTSTSTTSSSSSTTLHSASTSTTTTTTTTTMPPSCTLDVSECTATACTCGPMSGADYHLMASGTVTGPVGTELRVNVNTLQGGMLDCGGWSRVFGNTIAGCDVIACCKRHSGEPASTAWNASEAIDSPCICPPLPGVFLHNYLIQCQLPPGPVTEIEKTTSPCP